LDHELSKLFRALRPTESAWDNEEQLQREWLAAIRWASEIRIHHVILNQVLAGSRAITISPEGEVSLVGTPRLGIGT
jgi:hypothetical protein